MIRAQHSQFKSSSRTQLHTIKYDTVCAIHIAKTMFHWTQFTLFWILFKTRTSRLYNIHPIYNTLRSVMADAWICEHYNKFPWWSVVSSVKYWRSNKHSTSYNPLVYNYIFELHTSQSTCSLVTRIVNLAWFKANKFILMCTKPHSMMIAYMYIIHGYCMVVSEASSSTITLNPFSSQLWCKLILKHRKWWHH